MDLELDDDATDHGGKPMMRWLARLISSYLILVGLMAHAGAVLGAWYVLREYQVTPRQAMVLGIERLGLNWPWLEDLVAPAPAYQDHVFDGQLRNSHPRILLPDLAEWSGIGVPALMAQREAAYEAQGIDPMGQCPRRSFMGLMACYVTTGDPETGAALLDAAKRFTIATPNVTGNYGNAWQLAMAYDFLNLYPEMSENDRSIIERRIVDGLERTLLLLDSPDPSLWHGRATLAAMAWLSAVVLDPSTPELRNLINRSQGHFLDVIEALALTEGWPEGYNYWIQNRAFLVMLAGSAYLNGLVNARHRDRVESILLRTGLWHLYATRPDGKIEGFGDEGSRVDLKDETRRVIDLIAQATRSRVMATFSRYLYEQHDASSYFRGYRWGFRLFNDPTVTPLSGEGLDAFRSLPNAELFGRDALNQAYLRSDWSPDATFISFRAGHSFTHHGHYDAGHFTIFKGAPLAVNSSVYGGGFFSRNRLHYSIRSVAKNTLLVMRPGERVRPNRVFTDNVSAGGQRLVLPTGSAIQSVRQWYTNLGDGMHLEGGTLGNFEHQPGAYTYLSADLTGAYNNDRYDAGGWGGKVQGVQRELFYLRAQDQLLVHDRVISVEPEYRQKWLLHTVNRPEVSDTEVLVGRPDNGILESPASRALVSNESSHLLIQRILPEDAIIRLVGGPDYQYYVEQDGDDSELNGTNMIEGALERPWFENALWRMEVQPSQPRQEVEFLLVLTPRQGFPPAGSGTALTSAEGSLAGVELEDEAVLFVDTEAGEVAPILPGGLRRLWLVGLPPLARAEARIVGRTQNVRASAAGVARVDLDATSSGRAVIAWR